MKKSLIIFSFLLIVFCAPSVFAQQEGNQLYYAIKHSVKPEKMDEYKELMKKLASACKEHNYPYTYTTCKSSYPDFYIFLPVKDHNEAKDLMEKAWVDVIPNMEQDWETIEGREDFCILPFDSDPYRFLTKILE